MNNIAIIPARGGSKRIPGKNIKDFSGKPIIAYSIETALQSGLFEEVMVSTDDEKIAEVAKHYGAVVPFMRSAKNSNDFATTLDVIKEVIAKYAQEGRSFEYGCCIYPAAPFVTPTILQTAFNKLEKEKFDCVFPVVKYGHPIWRSLKIEADKATMWWPENVNKRSQDLPAAYHDAGLFYWFDTKVIEARESLFTQNTGAIIVDELSVQDIDNPEDWKLAEFKYAYMQKMKDA